MAIAKLNSFFARHHRIIFGIFTVVIIIAFTDFLTPGTGITSLFQGRSRQGSAGEIFGSKVGYREVYDQAALDMLSAHIFRGYELNGEIRDLVNQQAFYTLAFLTAAERAGLRVSDEEVTAFLRRFFSGQDGKFSESLYRHVVDTVLPSEGFSEDMLFAAARQFLLINKLNELQTAAVVTTPGELELFRKMLAEEFEVMAGTFSAKDFLPQVKVDPAELEKFFQAHRDHHLIPAKMQAVAAVFPYSDFQAAALKQVNDAKLKEFYETNQSLFGEVKDGKFTPKPFNAVKAAVRTEFLAATARQLAQEQANAFVADAYESAGNAKPADRPAVFYRKAAAAKVKLVKTGLVSADSAAAGPIAERALVAELAGVFPDVPITNAVPGKEAVYVGYVTEMTPGRPAEFAEVKAEITKEFQNVQALALARASAAEVSSALQLAPAESRADRVKKARTPAFKALPKFTLMQGPGAAVPAHLAGEVLLLQNGAVSRALDTADGAMVFYLVRRQVPAQAPAKADADAMLQMIFANSQQALAQSEFQAYLSANCQRFADPAEQSAE